LNEEYVVMVCDLGDIWLTPKEARLSATAKAKGTKNVSLRGNIYATSTIRGFLKPETYKTMYTSKRRSWVCSKGSTHLWDEICSCKSMLNAPDRKKLENKPLTPEQERIAKLKADAMREWIKSCRSDFKRMGDSKKRSIFLKKYMEEHNEES